VSTKRYDELTPRPYTLDCMHVIYLKQTPRPSDSLYCSRCQKYEPLLLTATSGYSEIYDPSGEFVATRQGKYIVGICLYSRCVPPYQSKSTTSYNNLQTQMHTHYMRSHTKWGAIEIKKVDRLPPNSPPPF
jgi:hypothetical protein